MPRRGRSGGMRSPAPAPRMAPAPRAAPPPAPAPMAAQPPAMAQPKQPGMFAQMATTAAGVAVGSSVGHVIGHALTGGGGSAQAPAPVEAAPAAAAPAPIYQAAPTPVSHYDPNANPCRFQLDQFLECTQAQNDISLCSGFNEALKECKLRYGIKNLEVPPAPKGMQQ